MKSRALHILRIAFVLIVAIIYQECDSTLNIDEPQNFIRYIGGDGDQTGVDMVIDDEDNIYILGTSGATPESTMVYIVMTNPDGIVLWEKTYGDPGTETPKDIEMLDDGNLVVVADKVISGDRNFVIYIVSSANGDLLRDPVTAGSTGNPDYTNSVTQTLDGGYIVAGYYETAGYKAGSILRFNADLTPVSDWINNVQLNTGPVGSPQPDVVPVKVVQGMQSSGEDQFYTFGYTNSDPGEPGNTSDYNFFAYPANSTNVSLKGLIVIPGAYPDSQERLTSARPVPLTDGAGFVLAGYTTNPKTAKQELYLVRVIQDLTAGSVLPSEPLSYLLTPSKTVGSDLSSASDAPASIYPLASSGFVLLCQENTQGNSNIYLTKVDSRFNGAWLDSPHPSHVFGGVGNDVPGAVAETNDGKILACGTMVLGELNGQKKIVLMKLSPEGMLGN